MPRIDKFFMGRTFSYLRSNDLVYGPAIRSYMMGEAPLRGWRYPDGTPAFVNTSDVYDSALAELATLITVADPPVVDRWGHVERRFREWAGRPGLRERLRGHLRALSPQDEMRVVARSRETTTHFAWCLRDEPAEPFTFWHAVAFPMIWLALAVYSGAALVRDRAERRASTAS